MVGWNNPMVKGVLIGVGASLVGFAVYKHNEEKVDAFLNRHGVKVKTPTAGFETMSVEDLMRCCCGGSVKIGITKRGLFRVDSPRFL